MVKAAGAEVRPRGVARSNGASSITLALPCRPAHRACVRACQTGCSGAAGVQRVLGPFFELCLPPNCLYHLVSRTSSSSCGHTMRFNASVWATSTTPLSWAKRGLCFHLRRLRNANYTEGGEADTTVFWHFQRPTKRRRKTPTFGRREEVIAKSAIRLWGPNTSTFDLVLCLVPQYISQRERASGLPSTALLNTGHLCNALASRVTHELGVQSPPLLLFVSPS